MSAQCLYKYSHTVGVSAETGRGFHDPVDVAVDSGGILYVLNRAATDAQMGIPTKRVTMMTLDEEYLGEFSNVGSEDGLMMWPVSIVMDKDENIYISDEALHRISVFTKQGQFLHKWGVQGKGDGEFDRPACIAFDKDDNLMVVDALNNRIQKYSKDGRILGAWGKTGSGDGEFNMPWGIAIDGAGDVYVADWRNDRIQKFDGDGKHLASWGSSGQGDGEFHRPAGIAVDQDGKIFVADWGNERVQVLGADGSLLATFRGESGMSKWGQDYYVSNQDELQARQESNLEPELDLLPDNYLRDKSAATEKLFWGPTSVKLDNEGRFYVVESCRHRIQIYQKA